MEKINNNARIIFMENNIKIVHYSENFEEEHIKFASQYWSKRRRFTPEYIYWKFRSKKNEDTSFILAVLNNKIIGQLGLVPCKIIFQGEIIDSQWACDLMVAKDQRGKDIAKQLYEFAHQLKPITLGSDPSPAASKSMKKNGYKVLKGPWKIIYPIKLGEIFKLKKIDNRFLNWFYNPTLLFFYLFKNKYFVKSTFENYKEVLKNNKSDCTYSKVLHDETFLNWRLKSFKNYYRENDIYIKDKNVYFTGFLYSDSYYITDYKANNWLDFFRIISFIINNNELNKLKRIRLFYNKEKFSFFMLLL